MFLHLLCGIPASGKSTLSTRVPGYVISTDSIRKFLWNDESVVKHDRLVFRLAENIADYLLGKRTDVILDATNLSKEKRGMFIKIGHKYHARVALHWVNCPLGTALERNAARDRKVPETIIKALHKSFQLPHTEEGIDVIRLYDHNLQTVKIITHQFILKRGKINLLQK